MFRCQYCFSHLTLDEDKLIWVDIMKDSQCPYMYVADGTYKHAPHQDAAFYVSAAQDELVLMMNDIPIIRQGTLRFWLPDKQIALRTTDALVKAGIYHDNQLQFHRENNTFQELEVPELAVLSQNRIEYFKTLDEAIKQAKRIYTMNAVD